MGFTYRFFLIALLAFGAAPVRADTVPMTEDQREAEQDAAMKEALQTGTRGPADVKLRDEGSIHVPQGMVFSPVPVATRLMRAYGNSPGDQLVGVVLDPKETWVAIVNYVKEGYVKDDDAADLKAEDLLADLREGTDEANKDRVARGFPELEIVGWVQPPVYDKATHRLTWALTARAKGDEDPNLGVNYNTRLLGRDGYFVLNMLTDQQDIGHDKGVALSLLGGLGFEQGKRYEDFNSSTDTVAEYGLAALIGVVAAKKLGVIALAGAFILKFAKLGILAVAGAGAAIARIFRRKPKPQP